MKFVSYLTHASTGDFLIFLRNFSAVSYKKEEKSLHFNLNTIS